MTEETKALTPQQKFEDKIKNRLAEDLGSLIPNEVLSQMVTRAIEEMFFKRRERTDTGSWHTKTVILPSWFEEEITGRLRSLINQKLVAYFAENEAELLTRVEEEITRQAPRLLAEFFVAVINSKATTMMFGFEQAFEGVIQNMISRQRG